jgi:1-deoxy-D-xylulose-5-phosphate reductoisomerase
MRTPIAHALAYPERIEAGVEPLDLWALGGLAFEPPDLERFPCLALAYAALDAGGSAPILLNAANEVAVARFLAGQLPFARIARLVEEVLQSVAVGAVRDIDDVLGADASARRAAEECLAAAIH